MGRLVSQVPDNRPNWDSTGSSEFVRARAAELRERLFQVIGQERRAEQANRVVQYQRRGDAGAEDHERQQPPRAAGTAQRSPGPKGVGPLFLSTPTV